MLAVTIKVKSIVYNFFLLLRRWLNKIRFRQSGPATIMTAAEFCADRGVRLRIIETEHEIRRTLPVPADDGCDWRFKIEEARTTPPTFYVELDQMYVAACGYVFSPDGVLLTDVSNEIGSPSERHTMLRSGKLPDPAVIEGRVAVVDVSHGGNYFHFLFDCLPRLALLPRPEPDFYYIRAHNAFHKQYLELLGIAGEKVICPRQQPLLKVKRLCLPSLPGGSGNPTPAARDFLRRFLVRAGADGDDGSGRPDRIYISRRDVRSRVFANEDDLQDLLRDHGFTVVELAELEVREQIRLFGQVSTVVSPHGAGLANLVYARPGTRVIELFDARYFNVCYWALAELCGLSYHHLTGTSAGWRQGGWKYGFKSVLPVEPLRKMLTGIGIGGS